MSSKIFQINISPGGVPKTPVQTVHVGPLGLSQDKQTNTVHHGGPERAVCLYSLELIQELQKEGHGIFPGSIGENITTTGLDWALVEPGTRLHIGEHVLLEVTSYTSPCSTLVDSFIDQNFLRVSQKINPGWSRVYARVLTPGNISVGDTIAILSFTL